RDKVNDMLNISHRWKSMLNFLCYNIHIFSKWLFNFHWQDNFLDLRFRIGVGISILMNAMIILPRSSKENVACIHWDNITPNFIVILLANGKGYETSLRNFYFTFIVEPLQLV
ncbi:hypothetical protein L195_g053570, partial [Trifolium pratense]